MALPNMDKEFPLSGGNRDKTLRIVNNIEILLWTL